MYIIIYIGLSETRVPLYFHAYESLHYLFFSIVIWCYIPHFQRTPSWNRRLSSKRTAPQRRCAKRSSPGPAHRCKDDSRSNQNGWVKQPFLWEFMWEMDTFQTFTNWFCHISGKDTVKCREDDESWDLWVQVQTQSITVDRNKHLQAWLKQTQIWWIISVPHFEQRSRRPKNAQEPFNVCSEQSMRTVQSRI